MNDDQENRSPAELFALRDTKKRYEAVFIRIAKAHGIDSPLVLIAMAENNDENYAEILARHIEKSMANAQGEKRSPLPMSGEMAVCL